MAPRMPGEAEEHLSHNDAKELSQAQGEGKEKRDRERGTSSPPAVLMETQNSERQLTTRSCLSQT